MRLKRRSPGSYGYAGTCAWKGDGNWTVRVMTVGDAASADVSPMELFSEEVLAQQLRDAGVPLETVTVREDVCLIVPTSDRGRWLHSEGNRIQRVLRKLYGTHNGHPVQWSWYIPQYS